MLSICADVGEAFRVPHPPITELLDDVGVARYGDWVASAGFDFVGHWATVRASMIAEKYQLGRDEAIAVAALSSLHGRLTALVDAVLGIGDLDDEDSAATLASELERAVAGSPATGTGSGRTVGSMVPLVARPEVASALLEETMGPGGSGAEALGLMVESLEEERHRRDPTGSALAPRQGTREPRSGQRRRGRPARRRAVRPELALDPPRPGPLRERPRRRAARPGVAGPRRAVGRR